MSLLDPTPGEILDRMTVLTLKIENSQSVHFRYEFVALAERLAQRTGAFAEVTPIHPPPSLALVVEYKEKMLRVNRQIWEDVDCIRIAPHPTPPCPVALVFDIAGLGRRIADKNDERALLIREFNEKCGVNLPQEKIPVPVKV